MTFAPMLAAKTPPASYQYRFPVLASPKLDGIRAMVRNGVVVSRTLKPIPNRHVQKLFGRPELDGLDGELIVGSPTDPNAMQATTSGVMMTNGEPDVRYHVFDVTFMGDVGFNRRLDAAAIRAAGQDRVHVVGHSVAKNQGELDDFEAWCLAEGYEGAMVRDPMGAYKNGRSTAKEGGLIKLKRFEQSEAVVVGFEERMHNGNVATVDALGHTKRTTHQANKTGLGDLGALVCSMSDYNEATGYSENRVVFNIGTGFTAATRAAMWANRDELIGKVVTFKHFAAAGVVDAPRFPVFVGFRHPEDM